ncbi:MAG: cystathionine gamma-synthase [Actinomycetales bacterium]|nr:MAG: cystathionine gamma-synthase [Actinomycetales bacterium]
MTDTADRLSGPRALATIAVTAGRPDRAPGAPVNPPVDFSSTYAVDPDSEQAPGYGRFGNSTWAAFEQTVGALEGGTALVFGSGMAAISAALTLVPADRPFVVPTAPYSTTRSRFDELAASGVDVRRVPLHDTDAAVRAVTGDGDHAPAGAVWIESPTNPLLDVADLPVLINAAHRVDARTMCDNTLATPVVQRPLDLGADVVVHSVTKYLAGHSDVVLGVCVVNKARPELIHQLHDHRTRHGAIAGPMETWLALRGIRTLQVRVDRATANAETLATRLGEHPAVSRVRWPGSGAMLAIEIGADPGDPGPADQVADSVRLWTPATSLGGVESLIERRRRYPGESREVPESLLRLSVGIEDVEDLWHDLEAALSGLPRR